MNHGAYPDITKWLIVILVAVCLMGLTVAMKNPEFVQSMQRIVQALKK
jgi:Sec-independent protein translocase protein TatA